MRQSLHSADVHPLATFNGEALQKASPFRFSGDRKPSAGGQPLVVVN
jgi:hypothetical protein